MGLPGRHRGAGSLPRWAQQGTGEWGLWSLGHKHRDGGRGMKGEGDGGRRGRESPARRGQVLVRQPRRLQSSHPGSVGFPCPLRSQRPRAWRRRKGRVNGSRGQVRPVRALGPCKPSARAARQGQPRGHPCPPCAHTHTVTHTEGGSSPDPHPGPLECLWMSLRQAARRGGGSSVWLLIGRLAGVYPIAVHVHWF